MYSMSEDEINERLEAEHRVQRALRAEAGAAADRLLLGAQAVAVAAPVTDLPEGFRPTNRLRFARWLVEQGRLSEQLT